MTGRPSVRRHAIREGLMGRSSGRPPKLRLGFLLEIVNVSSGIFL
jgi:hypothetical protein